MQGFKVIFFAIFAILTAGVIADVTGKFNIVSKYKAEKVVNGKKTTVEQRNPILYEKKGLKSDKTLDALVKNFNDWSGGEFNAKKARAGSLYNVEATKVYKNKDDSTAANNRAKKVINDNAQKE
ncbi:hypothetical protein PG999_010855 [Apiospora kogelbergensis]|uniref:Uncharacterized protein n=1 Tax=Apiospora kogelbergensis TaxID=1337665 RepID=A0AAW0QFI5_9PEZI